MRTNYSQDTVLYVTVQWNTLIKGHPAIWTPSDIIDHKCALLVQINPHEIRTPSDIKVILHLYNVPFSKNQPP